MDEAYQKFIPKYKRNYKTKDEANKRKKEFERNWNIVKKHNATDTGYAIDINEFSDWTVDEFNKILALKPLNGKRKTSTSGSGSGSTSTNTSNTTTNALDWR